MKNPILRSILVTTVASLALLSPARAELQVTDEFERDNLIPGSSENVTWEVLSGEWRLRDGKAQPIERGNSEGAAIALARPNSDDEVRSLKAALDVSPRTASAGRPWLGLIFDYDPDSNTGYIARLSNRETGGILQIVYSEFSDDGSSEGRSVGSRNDLDLNEEHDYRIEIETKSPGVIDFKVTNQTAELPVAEGTVTDPSPREKISGTTGLFSSRMMVTFDNFEVEAN